MKSYRAEIGILTLTENVIVPVTYDSDTWRDVEVDAGRYTIFGHFTWDEDNGLQLVSAYAPADGMTVGGSMYSVHDTGTCVGEPWSADIKVATHGYLSNIDKLLKGVVLHPGICAYEDGDENLVKSLKMWQLGIDRDNFKLVTLTDEPESDGHFESEVVPVKRKDKGDLKVKYVSGGMSIAPTPPATETAPAGA